MEFDKSKVYTALNADELKVGSKVILADDLGSLKDYVEKDRYTTILTRIKDEEYEYRFVAEEGTCYHLAYLVETPEEKKLVWTDLKLGDIIRNNNEHKTAMVIAIDEDDCPHIFAGNWLGTLELEDWEKVED